MSARELEAAAWKAFGDWCEAYREKHPEAEELSDLELVEIYHSDKDDVSNGGPIKNAR